MPAPPQPDPAASPTGVATAQRDADYTAPELKAPEFTMHQFRAQEGVEACYLVSVDPPREAWWRRLGEITYGRC